VNGIGNGSVALANVAITGGTISGNTTASNVTVSSGTFTNVTLSNVTISSVSTPITAAEGGTGSSSAFTANGVVYASSTSALATGSALVFDGSNLGLGVTPSAWGSGFKGFELSYGSAYATSVTSAFGYNFYYNGTNWVYKNNGYASMIQYGSTISFFTGTSGSAGGTISGFSTASMTLDNSGNLGVGTTSPSVRLHVANSGDNVSYFERVGGSRVILYNASGDSYFGTTTNTPLRFATNNTECARIDTSGNLLLATTSTPASAVGVLAMGNATAPTGNITGGSLYVSSGALYFRGSSGTVTKIANA